jgi:hypothetical protein
MKALKTNTISVALVRKRSVATERPPLVGEFSVNFSNCKISGYHSNRLSSDNTFHECKLCSSSRTSEQSLFQFVTADNISRWICEEQYIR